MKRYAAPALAAVAILALLGWAVHALVQNAGAPKKRVVQQISLVKPPLPPKQEKPPEPEMVKEEVKQEIKEPEPQPVENDSPPPAEDLGLDAQGTAGGDSFGLVGRPGGRDITTIGNDIGTGRGSGRMNTAFYASQLQSQLQDELNRDEKLRAAEYRALVHLWLDPTGAVSKVELAGSTGDADLDRRLRDALAEARKLRPPPEGVGQPIRLELVARRT